MTDKSVGSEAQSSLKTEPTFAERSAFGEASKCWCLYSHSATRQAHKYLTDLLNYIKLVVLSYAHI